ncbi:DUF4349 domain-containing protein [Neolewinella persica]|uniref:DUF4349 domain-containing protein n=1 Tax=Neolewinella persica TaxID=70998 RepID=UPI00035CB7EA|nr:DUF4349 domain-containing protein [Neolewinella persica]
MMKPQHLLLPLLLCIQLLSGCTPSRSATLADAYADETYSVDYSDPAFARPATRIQQEDRKRIFSANIGLIVSEPDSTSKRIIAVAHKAEGFMTQSSSNGVTIRVPADEFENIIAQIQALGKTRYKRLMGEDVTDAYRDYGIRLDNAEQSRQRYLELLAKAVNVEETLLVERELERLNETIDLLKGKMNRLDQLEAYATISVDLQRKAKLGPLGFVFKGLYSGVKWLFVRK